MDNDRQTKDYILQCRTYGCLVLFVVLRYHLMVIEGTYSVHI